MADKDGRSPSGRAVVNGAGQAVSALRASVPSAGARCGNCAFSTYIEVSRFGPGLCCWRYPPTIHRHWFRLIELYPAVVPGAICAEHVPAQGIETAKPPKREAGSARKGESPVGSADAPLTPSNPRSPHDRG
jgi:hypothetical protein